MYWVPGNRYQVFELEPLRKLLPPHDTVLQELFGVLEEMQSSLLQGYADTTMGLGKEYKRFLAATARGVCPEEATKSSASYATEFMDKLHSSDFIHAFVMQFIGTNQVFKPLIAIHFYASNRCFSTRGPRWQQNCTSREWFQTAISNGLSGYLSLALINNSCFVARFRRCDPVNISIPIFRNATFRGGSGNYPRYMSCFLPYHSMVAAIQRIVISSRSSEVATRLMNLWFLCRTKALKIPKSRNACEKFQNASKLLEENRFAEERRWKFLQTAWADKAGTTRNCIQRRNAAMFQNLFTAVFLRRTSQNQGNKFIWNAQNRNY